MPTQMLTRDERRVSPGLSTAASTEDDELVAAVRRQAKRVHRLKLNVVAWVLGTIALTTLWVGAEWQANGAFEHFGNEGNRGDWNPTLWALAVGALGADRRDHGAARRLRAARRRRPRSIARSNGCSRSSWLATRPLTPELRRLARTRIERLRRLTFHAAAWVLGMVVLTPLWALIEWQDNGGLRALEQQQPARATGSPGSSTSAASGRSQSRSSPSGRTSSGRHARRRAADPSNAAGERRPPTARAGPGRWHGGPRRSGIDLYWLPLGAGGHSVRLNGRVYETVAARLQRRQPRDLYHAALEVRLPEGRFVIEQAPVRDADGGGARRRRRGRGRPAAGRSASGSSATRFAAGATASSQTSPRRSQAHTP